MKKGYAVYKNNWWWVDKNTWSRLSTEAHVFEKSTDATTLAEKIHAHTTGIEVLVE